MFVVNGSVVSASEVYTCLSNSTYFINKGDLALTDDRDDLSWAINGFADTLEIGKTYNISFNLDVAYQIDSMSTLPTSMIDAGPLFRLENIRLLSPNGDTFSVPFNYNTGISFEYTCKSTGNFTLYWDHFSAISLKNPSDYAYYFNIDYTLTISNVVIDEIRNKLTDNDALNEINDEIHEQTEEMEEQTEIMEEQKENEKNFFDNFFGNLIDAIIGLFIPEDGYFTDFFSRLNDFFSEKLGLLYAPIGIFVDILTSIANADTAEVGLYFPGIKWEDTYIVEPQTFNFSSLSGKFGDLQEKIYFVTDVIMVGSVLWLLQIKLKEVLQN